MIAGGLLKVHAVVLEVSKSLCMDTTKSEIRGETSQEKERSETQNLGTTKAIRRTCKHLNTAIIKHE